MKLTKILMSIAVIAIACSCKKEKMAAETESIPQTHEPITRSVTDAMLSFGSEEEMFDRIQQLKNMDEAEMAAWYESQCPDFLSQYDFMWQIVEELDNAASMDEVRAIQAGCQGKMLFNTNPEDEDISPYIPSSHRGTEFVCNSEGNVLIGGEVCNYNDLTYYEQTSDYRSTHPQIQTRAANKQWLAGRKAETKDRKFWVEAYLNTITEGVELKLAAHKKGMFGWNQYKTAYSIRMEQFTNWQEIGVFAADILSVSPNYYVTRDMKSSQYFPFARGRQAGQPYASFFITAYSRGVKDANALSFGVACSPTVIEGAQSFVDGYYDLNQPIWLWH